MNKRMQNIRVVPQRNFRRCTKIFVFYILIIAIGCTCSIAQAFLPRQPRPTSSSSPPPHRITGTIRHPHHGTQNICETTTLFAKSGSKKKKVSGNTVAVNRSAYHNYEIVSTMEVGIALKGTEVKSCREGKLNLKDGFVRPNKNGRSCTLLKVHIGKCSTVGAEYFQHEEMRPRPLLLHASEARKLLQQTEQAGMTIVPLKAYWSERNNKLKIQIALCRGKNVRDKRASIRERDIQRETNRIVKNFRI